MVDCANCGATLGPDARFCSACGERVANDDDGEWGGTADWGETDDRSDWGETEGGFDEWGEPEARTRARESPRREGGDTTLAAAAHVLGLLTWVIGPLIVLFVADDEFASENARNALNWQLMFTIYMLVSVVLIFVLVGFLLVMVVPLLNVAFCVLAAIKAYDGETWTYPATIEFV